MKKPQSQIEKAITFIAERGSARSPEIAEHLGIKASSVQATLFKPLEDGYLVTCKVEIPGKHPINEYRLSALVSESNQTWADFKAARRLPTKDLKIAKERPPREAVATNAPLPEAPVASAPPMQPDMIIPSGRVPKFLIDHEGKLRIEFETGEQINFNNQQTRSVGELLAACETLWN